jgi:catechol 2,3-dioxygenase-like lactoylglutathione lyase family enzyme
MRLQLALNVRNLEEAVSYYSKLFGVQPHKERPGYANFAIDRPPLKLVLFENPHATERLNHLGVEVFKPEEVETAFQRLEPEGLVEEVQRGETCCYATQDKVWSREPQGLRWEWYRITDDDPVAAAPSPAASCCAAADTPSQTGCP